MEDFKGKYKKQFNYIAANYQFRFNVVTSFYEYRTLEKIKGKKVKTYSPWQKYGDRIQNLILIKLMELDLDLPKDKFNIFIESEIMSPDYDPFLEYFNNLPEWDQKTDYIGQVAETVKTADPEHFRNTFQRFLVGTLDCLLEEDAVNDVCLVFQSGQGVGKTRWMRSLLPKRFQSEYLYEGNIDTRNKDHTMYLSQYWYIHLDELETLKQNDIGAIKSYITRQRISTRKAYGRYTSHFIRRASFLGSVNDDKFLTDITGNRRWLVFKTFSINYEHEIDVDKMWAQVYFLWKEGFKHWFDINEIKIINEVNEQFRSMSLEEEMLLQSAIFEDETSGHGEFLSSADMLAKLGNDRPGFINKLNSQKMGRALAKHCKAKKTVNGFTKYWLTWTATQVALDQEHSESHTDVSSLNKNEFGQKKIVKTEIHSEEVIPPNVVEDDNEVPF